jgi:hypothetical protein
MGESGATMYEYEPSAPEWWREEREREREIEERLRAERAARNRRQLEAALKAASLVVVVIALLLSVAVAATPATVREGCAAARRASTLSPHLDPPNSCA